MANTLTSFLIGIGLDTNEFNNGAKEVASGLDSIKSKALGIGTVMAGAFGAAKISSDFASYADKLGKFGQTFGIAANDVAGFGRAIELSGGDFNTALSQLEQIEKWRAAFQVGDTSWFQAAGMAGVDYNAVITSTDALQALLAQADKFKAASPQMRLNMADALGVDPATLRLLSRGRAEATATIEKFKAMRPLSEDATRASAEFNKELLNLQLTFGALTDNLANKTIPILTMALKGWNAPAEDVAKSFNQKILGKSAAGDVVRGAVGVISPEYEKTLKKQVGVKEEEEKGSWYQRGIDWTLKYYGYGDQSGIAMRGPVPEVQNGPIGIRSLPSEGRNRAEMAAIAAENRTSPPQPPIIVHTHLNLDGREIDNRIVEVNQRGHRSTLDDVRSTTSR